MQMFKIEIRITKSELDALEALRGWEASLPASSERDARLGVLRSLLLVARPEPVLDITDGELAQLREYALARGDRSLLADVDTAPRDERAYQRCVGAWRMCGPR